MSGPDADKEDVSIYRIVKIELDERSLARATADIEHERKVAIYDLLEENFFNRSAPGMVRLSFICRMLSAAWYSMCGAKAAMRWGRCICQ